MINWLFRCREAGVLTERDTGLPLAEIGTADFLETLLRSICMRQGFGGVLAEGMARAADLVSPEARALMGHGVAPIGELELLPPRVIFVHALLYPMEPRVFQPLVHDTGFVLHAWTRNQKDPAGCPITGKVVRDIAKAFWGSEEAGDMATYEGKALAAKLIQNRVILKDTLGLCDFTWPVIYSFVTPDHVGDPELESKLYSAVTGRPPEELERYAEIIANLQRVILIREGRKVPEADRLPDFHFTEPFGGPEAHFAKVPGRDGEAVDMTGTMLDRAKCEAMLREYYGLRGWDEDAGSPKLETLRGLGMEDVAATIGGRVGAAGDTSGAETA